VCTHRRTRLVSGYAFVVKTAEETRARYNNRRTPAVDISTRRSIGKRTMGVSRFFFFHFWSVKSTRVTPVVLWGGNDLAKVGLFCVRRYTSYISNIFRFVLRKHLAQHTLLYVVSDTTTTTEQIRVRRPVTVHRGGPHCSNGEYRLLRLRRVQVGL